LRAVPNLINPEAAAPVSDDKTPVFAAKATEV